MIPIFKKRKRTAGRMKSKTMGKWKKTAALTGSILLVMAAILVSHIFADNRPVFQSQAAENIKWVEFDVPYSALNKAMELDISTYKTETHLDWVEVLSYLAGKYGGDFNRYKAADMDELAQLLLEGEYAAHLAKKNGFEASYDYYLEAYSAVLDGFLGEFKIQVPESEDSDKYVWKEQYGLKAYSPIAEGYWYTDYDDFGAGRSYGYNRRHLGHDMMISTGTPVIAIESGTVEAIGWNQYGGWRIGIRSFDKKRYYYYAHLRKDTPYASGLKTGQTVSAGDVIGYSGQTGYSIKENVNNIDTPHLHYGMQLIFKEEERDSPNQIWIDLYSITRLLSQHRSTVVRDEDTGEYYRKFKFEEPNPYLNDVPEDQQLAAALAISASSAPEGSIPVPIIMYHGLLKEEGKQNRFIIDPKLLEKDLKYLKEKGYTTILLEDLIAFNQKDVPLPEKPIILTFDDGYYNNYLYAYPLLKEYDMKAVISIIGKETDEYTVGDRDHANYSHITWDQLDEMIKSGHIEVQNHSYDLHSNTKGRIGVDIMPGEDEASYKDTVGTDIIYLQHRIEEMTSSESRIFTYPFGSYSDASEKLIKDMGFLGSLSSYEGINYIPTKDKSPEDLFLLKRILRPNDLSTEEFFSRNGIEQQSAAKIN